MAKIQQLAEEWVQEAEEITSDQIAAMARAIEPLRVKFAEARVAAEQVNRQFCPAAQVQMTAREDDRADNLDEPDEDEEDDEVLPDRPEQIARENDGDQDEYSDDPFEDLSADVIPSDVLLEMQEDEGSEEDASDGLLPGGGLGEAEEDEPDDPENEDGDEWPTEDEEDEPVARPSGVPPPPLFPFEDSARLASFRRAIDQARTAREVVEADVKLLGEPGCRKASLVGPSNARLTNWIVDGSEITLKDKYRYVCILAEAYTWGWVRVNGTVFSIIAPNLILPSPVMLGDFLCHRFAFEAIWGRSLDIQGNLKVTAYPDRDRKHRSPW